MCDSSQQADTAESKTCYECGSQQKPFRLAILGGGPAGTSIIARAIHLGFAIDLFSDISTPNVDGSCKMVQYGGVCIFDCNTKARFGGGRLQDYQINSNTYGGKFVTNLTENRVDYLPPERASGTILERVGQQYETRVAPLSEIGNFLTEVGDAILTTIAAFNPTSKCHTETRVTQIQQMPDSKIWKITALDIPTNSSFDTYAVSVVLATGGEQPLPSLHSLALNRKVMTSDHVCTQAGIDELMHRMKHSPRKKIVIIGGSHSAFSAAWICLNRLGWGSDSQLGANASPSTQPHSIYIIHRSPIKVYYATKREADRDKYTGYVANKQGQIHPFSGLRGDAKILFNKIKTGQETRVRLLATGADGQAHQTMYNRLCDEADVIVWSCGYSAHIPYDILNEEGTLIPIHRVRGQVEVDDQARVLACSSRIGPFPTPVDNLFATGLGFGLNVSGDTQDASSTKADGVEVYLRRAATIILSHVIGTKVFGEGCKSWDQHCAENWKRILAAQVANRAARRGENGDVEIDPENECSKVFASPTRSSRSKRGAMSPASSSPIPHSPIRRIARTAEPRNRVTKGNSNAGSPQPTTRGGNRTPLHSILPSPLKKTSTPSPPAQNRKGITGRTLRSMSSGHSLMNKGDIPLPSEEYMAIAEPMLNHIATIDVSNNQDGDMTLSNSTSVDTTMSGISDIDASPPPEYSEDDMPQSVPPAHASEMFLSSRSVFGDANDDNMPSLQDLKNQQKVNSGEEYEVNDSNIDVLIAPTNCLEARPVARGSDRKLHRVVKCNSEDSRNGYDLLTHLPTLSTEMNVPLQPHTPSLQFTGHGRQGTKQVGVGLASPILRRPPSSTTRQSSTTGSVCVKQQATLLSSSMPTTLTDVLTAEKRTKKSSTINEAVKFKIGASSTLCRNESSSALLVCGKRTLPSIAHASHTPSQLKNVKKLLVLKSAQLASHQNLHLTKKVACK